MRYIVSVRDDDGFPAARTAFQISGAVFPVTQSTSSVNCPLRMHCINSTPAIVFAAVRNGWKPSIGLMRDLMSRYNPPRNRPSGRCHFPRPPNTNRVTGDRASKSTRLGEDTAKDFCNIDFMPQMRNQFKGVFARPSNEP